MNQPAKSKIELLLDQRFDELDADDQRWLEERLAQDPSWDQADRALGRVLERLDAHWTPGTPPNLADKVMRYVDRHGRQPSELERRRTMIEASTPPAGRFRLRDLLMVAACIALFVGVMTPAMMHLRGSAQRVRCADNMSIIYQALSQYGREFGGALPSTGTLAGASWLYSRPTDYPHASNSRHMFLLVSQGLLDEQWFRCPSSRRSVATNVSAEPREPSDDFAGPDSCSYDSLNMAGPTPSMFDAPEQTYVSDPNPLFMDGVFRASVNPNTTNSPLHDGGKGQNVLTLGGTVQWMTSPFRNRRDNLWLAGDRQEYIGVETQEGPDDAFLIPATPARR